MIGRQEQKSMESLRKAIATKEPQGLLMAGLEEWVEDARSQFSRREGKEILQAYSKKLGKAIVRKKDGTSNYMTRDIGAVFERDKEYHYDKVISVIASQQNLHKTQLIKIVEIIGRKMSARRGTVKFLDGILRDARDKVHEVMKANRTKYEQVEDRGKTADILSISADLVQDMCSKPINGYTFDTSRMTSFEGWTFASFRPEEIEKEAAPNIVATNISTKILYEAAPMKSLL
ncbi:Arginyl-tRNA synthetase [Aspergillus hancockii]|nr:Arginyl-tRNA synthetase [Aspergillus hancockii]